MKGPPVVEHAGTTRPARGACGRLPRPAVLVALLTLLGLGATLRARPVPPPPPPPPVRYDTGVPFANRLIVIFGPRLDDRGLTALGSVVRPDPPGRVAHFTTARPEYASFPEITAQLLAGTATLGNPISPPGQPLDTLVNAVHDRGRGVTLIGPPEWRALFAIEPAPVARATPIASTVSVAARTLRDAPDKLVVIYLAELSAREVNGSLRVDLARLGDGIGPSDALLLVGGGGAPGTPLALALSGPGVRQMPVQELPFNDIAPTCAVIAGAPYPYDARGGIAWPLLATDTRVKATATAALARQRSTLAARAVPFGALYSPTLQEAIAGLPTIESVLQNGEYAYGYQLASSAVERANQSLDQTLATPLYSPPRRAAWPLVAAALVLSLVAPLLALARRRMNALAPAVAGFVLALASWLLLVNVLGGVLPPSLPFVVLALALPAALGGRVVTWRGLSRRRLRQRGDQQPLLTIDLLVLLATLPIAFCALRYGYPWQLRADEAELRLRWQSALLAPALLTIASYGWILLFPPRTRRAGLVPQAHDAAGESRDGLV